MTIGETEFEHRGFEIKDSGKRQEFESGMVRDTAEGKIDFHRTFDGPLFLRWAIHLTKGAVKYPDVHLGNPNWMLANSWREYYRFKVSAFHHFFEWFIGKRDEDHMAALVFNLNGAEYVRDRLEKEIHVKPINSEKDKAEESPRPGC